MTDEELPKVYIYPAGKAFVDDWVMVALSEDGEWHLSHICSSPSWGYHDLHDVRREAYEKQFGGFGDGKFYQIVVVDKADDIPLPTLVAAKMRNEDGSRFVI